ncbi:hypothetical protein ACRALDRAFT_1079807 [Sodiomyces alcalophilus JCM 7366]|uniref:uncharacterized protein n=1 Tax=Sodiomyces alcalophilus JCM 7366 TaxID=591952 RepID=UPI0039B3D5F2
MTHRRQKTAKPLDTNRQLPVMDANELPRSAFEAEEHIRKIRKDKGLGDGLGKISHNTADLEAALDVLSTDLYQTTTHFLLELIQNADDNQYEAAVPTLRIAYSPGTIRIDCNERGFSRRNVEAICRICQSTKSGRSKSSGFVGEKGIGFKAVFKVASTVHIVSGHYQFKFERDGYLGMIAPIWATFPEPTIPGWTSIVLKLDDKCDEAAVVKELRLYDARILIFLRRLRRLEIDVNMKAGPKLWNKSTLWGKKKNRKNSIPQEANAELHTGFRNVLTRRGQPASSSSSSTSGSQSSMTILHENDKKKYYLVWRHMANKLPAESRRPDISSSEVVLAFPLESDGRTPFIAPQSVYAFLPIRDYGFNFLLQADFLLSSSREDIHGDSAWNEALAVAASDAFVKAALSMSSLPEGHPLRYTWLLFVPRTVPSSQLMRNLRYRTMEKLRASPVIYTRESGGERKSPTELSIVPDLFCDRDGNPFMEMPKDAGKYVSKEYDVLTTDDMESPLHRLGTKSIDDEQFMDSMLDMLRPNPGAVLQHKSPEWHVDLSRALHSIVTSTVQKCQKTKQEWSQTHVAQRLLDLPIIPLRDGNWVRNFEDGQYIYYPETGSGVGKVPEGIDMRIVDHEAAADPDRRRLFDHLGVATMVDTAARAAILKTHASEAFKPDLVRRRVLVSHLVFLFHSGWKHDVEKPSVLWLASEKGPCRKSDHLYLPSDVPSAAYRVLPPANRDTAYGFVHRAYMDGAVERDKQDEWTKWLESEVHIAVYPRIKRTSFEDGSWTHPDFELLQRSPPKRSSPLCWLTVLRDGWEYYTDATKTTSPFAHMTPAIIGNLRDIVVPCRKSSWSADSAPLHSAYMPAKDLMDRAFGLVPFIDIPDPENPAWEPVMRMLRVQSTPSLEFYVDCLRRCKTHPKVPQDTIRRLLHSIQDQGTQDPVELRNLFNNDRLICIPHNEDNGERTWVKPLACVWKGRAWMVEFHVLKKYYPELEVLFRTMLLVPNASTSHFVEEALAVASRTASTKSTRRIESILHAIASRVVENLDRDPDRADGGLEQVHKMRLSDAQVFPIVSGPKNHPYERLASVKDKESWLIADRAIFRTQFANVLPVLALDADVVLRIQPLLEALGLGDRLLSRVATNVTEAHGEVTPLEDLAAQYRERSKFLFRLMPPGQPNRDQLRAKFRSVDVFSATTILQYWRAPLELRQIQSAQTTGTAFLESDYFGDLRVYMPTGYETEPHPFELVDQLCEFFSIPTKHRDLVLLALTAGIERVEEVFTSRGIGEVADDGPRAGPSRWVVADGDGDGGVQSDADSDDYSADYDSAEDDAEEEDAEAKKSEGTSRFNRLLNRKRFHPSFFKQRNVSSDSLPSYDTAVARTAHGGVMGGRLAPTRKLPSVSTLPSLKKTIREMEFHQRDGAVFAEPTRPLTLLDRIRGLAQRDDDIGEMIISDALGAILGPQYKPDTIWTPRSKRRPSDSAFTFVDSQGRFSSFLMRLEGRTGKAQGYNKLMYHLDVKATERPQTSSFRLTQAELDRARNFSIHSEKALSDEEPNKHVSVLVHMSDVRDQPKILFLVDPWDLFKDGQLILETTSTYKAGLRLGPREVGRSRDRDAAAEGGFDVVQIRQRNSPRPDEAPPDYVDVKGKGVEAPASDVGVTAGPSSEMAEVRKGESG